MGLASHPDPIYHRLASTHPTRLALVLPSDERPLPQLRTQELIEHANAGSRSAWGEIYTRYHRTLEPIVRARLVWFTAARVDADDVLQSAFLLAWQRLSKFEYQGEGSLLRWITTVTLNKLNDQLRASPVEQPKEIPEDGARTTIGPNAAVSPLLEAETAEYRLHLIQCVSELDEQEQEILTVRLFEKLPWRDASIRIGKKSFDGMKEQDAEIWVTDCPLAALQFNQHAGKNAMHPMSVLARAYRKDGF